MTLVLVGITIALLMIIIIHLLYKLVNRQEQSCNSMRNESVTIVGPYSPMSLIQQRDEAVLNKDLYPPISRDNVENTRRLMREPRLQPTSSDSLDSYQLVGYLTSRDDKLDTWKLIARSRGHGRADFYVQSSNTQLDVKIPLSQDIAKSADGSTNRPFKEMYDLPRAVVMNHAMFKGSIYDVIELPRAELGSGYM